MPVELMVIESFAVAVAGGVSESETWAVKLNVPTATGAPEMIPVVGARDVPGGSEPPVRPHT
jgi:hypothetical protein